MSVLGPEVDCPLVRSTAEKVDLLMFSHHTRDSNFLRREIGWRMRDGDERRMANSIAPDKQCFRSLTVLEQGAY